MPAYQLLARLTHLTLSPDNSQEYWEDKLEWTGSRHDWHAAEMMEQSYEQ